MMVRLVAYSGERGAFAEHACQAFLPECEPVPVPHFAAVAAGVASKAMELGMLPLANRLVGPVPGVADLIEANGLSVLSRHELPVRLHLMVCPGTKLEELKVVQSHPVALGQCTRALDRLGLRREAAPNTASAAVRLAASGERARAVVASEIAASLYGLQILCRDIQDVPDNVTIFGVVERSL